MKKKQLQPGWISSPLNNLITPRRFRVLPTNFPKSRYIGLEHVEAHTMKLLGSIVASEMKSSAAKFEARDVLYGRLRPYLNKVIRPEFDGLCSAEFIVFPDTPLLRSSFLQYRLNSYDFVSYASHLNEGDRPRVDFEEIGKFEINLPPEKEQIRIVEKIEELFSDLDAGVAALKRVKEKLKSYRASVLKAAVEGKLTEEWRKQNPNVEPAKNLLKQILLERLQKCPKKRGYVEPVNPNVEKLKKLPENWTWATLDQLMLQICNGTTAKQISEPVGVPVSRIETISLAKIDLKRVRYVNGFTNEEIKKWKLENGDILFSHINSDEHLGKTALFELPKTLLLHGMNLLLLRSVPELVNPKLIHIILTNFRFSGFFLSIAQHAVNQSSINILKLKGICLPLPPLLEQIKIVEEVDRRLSVVEEAEKLVIANLKRAIHLKQSILKRAFEGKLIPQDPKDESAEKLLVRIREESAIKTVVRTKLEKPKPRQFNKKVKIK